MLGVGAFAPLGAQLAVRRRHLLGDSSGMTAMVGQLVAVEPLDAAAHGSVDVELGGAAGVDAEVVTVPPLLVCHDRATQADHGPTDDDGAAMGVVRRPVDPWVPHVEARAIRRPAAPIEGIEPVVEAVEPHEGVAARVVAGAGVVVVIGVFVGVRHVVRARRRRRQDHFLRRGERPDLDVLRVEYLPRARRQMDLQHPVHHAALGRHRHVQPLLVGRQHVGVAEEARLLGRTHIGGSLAGELPLDGLVAHEQEARDLPVPRSGVGAVADADGQRLGTGGNLKEVDPRRHRHAGRLLRVLAVPGRQPQTAGEDLALRHRPVPPHEPLADLGGIAVLGG